MRVIRMEQFADAARPRAEFRIAGVRVLPDRNLLRSAYGDSTLEPKVMDVLCFLFGRAGQTLSREDILSGVWQQRFGGDESLTRAVSILRKRFGELAPGVRIIETIPKRGYRLVQLPGALPHSGEPSSPTPQDGVVVISVRRGTLAFAASLALVATHIGVIHGDSLGHGVDSVFAALTPGDGVDAVSQQVREAAASPPQFVEPYTPVASSTCDGRTGPAITPALLPVWETSL